MNIIVNARKESRDSDKFICKTNDDVNEWMDEFYVDGRDASFNLHCLWAWQEQERRHGSLIAEIESLKKDAARYRWLRVNEFDIGSYHPEGDHNHESWFEHFDDQSIDRGIADEAEFAAEAMDRDEIPDFTPGNGNKARRLADELGIDYDAAMGNKE